jgi:hypothetical protein
VGELSETCWLTSWQNAPRQFPKIYKKVEGILLPTERHTQNNKDQGRRPVTRRRERKKERERDSERKGKKRREGSRGSAEAGRAEGQAEMKVERERKPNNQDMLEEHRSCRGHAQRPLHK